MTPWPSKRDRLRRAPFALAAIAGAAVLVGGCGGDDDETTVATTTTTSTTASTGATGATGTTGEAGSVAIDDAQANLEAAGYTVKLEQSEPLIRRDDGGVVQPLEKLIVTGGDLASGSDVSVYSLESQKDVEAMEDFAGGDMSLVVGKLFFQSAEAGEAEAIADAAQG
jgi:hypothetical protein